MENTEIANNALSNAALSPAPRFGIPAGIGAIFTYLLSSLPLIAYAGVKVANDNESKNLNSKDLADKINDYISRPSFMILILLVNAIGLLVWAFFVSRIRGSKNFKNDFGLKFTPDCLIFFAVGIGIQLVSVVLAIPISLIKDDVKGQAIADDLASAKGVSLILFAICVAFIIPVIEEICFRGIFLRGLLRKTKPVIAILICGLLFAVVHLSDKNAIYGLTSLIIVGIVSSALSVYRGRIDASIALHVGFNLTAAIFLIVTN